MNKAGDTITGDIIMSGNKITDLGSPTDNTDSVTLGYAKEAFAPNGYGIGGACRPVDTWDNAKQTGFYRSPVGGPDNGSWHGFTVNNGIGILTQIAFLRGNNTHVYEAHRVSGDVGKSWNKWEWLNPPMYQGIEYLTAERYQGRTVYVKIVNFGALPNASFKSISHGIEGMEYLVYKDCTAGYYHFPVNCDQSSSIGVVDVYVNSTSIQITTTVDWSNVNGYVKLKYTKNT